MKNISRSRSTPTRPSALRLRRKACREPLGSRPNTPSDQNPCKYTTARSGAVVFLKNTSPHDLQPLSSLTLPPARLFSRVIYRHQNMRLQPLLWQRLLDRQ